MAHRWRQAAKQRFVGTSSGYFCLWCWRAQELPSF
nr:MAG TPA: hypothetical protein [Caudoviricetes sp.]